MHFVCIEFSINFTDRYRCLANILLFCGKQMHDKIWNMITVAKLQA